MNKIISKINFSILILFSFLITACNSDVSITNPEQVTKSDLTREGKFIAFCSNYGSSNYNVYLAQVDSTGHLASTNLVYPINPFNLTAGLTSFDNKKQPAWSPDGRILTFSASYGYIEEIFAYFFDLNGKYDSSVSPNPRKLFISDNSKDENPNFSSNMRYIVFDRRRVFDDQGNFRADNPRDIYIGNIYGSGANIFIDSIRSLTNTPIADESNPKWSPRIIIQKIAYEYSTNITASDRSLYIMDPLSPTNNLVYHNVGKSGYAAWNPICDGIVFEFQNNSTDYYKVVRAGYPANLGATELISSDQFEFRHPVRKPNSNLIAYVKKLPYYFVGNIWIYNLETASNFKLLPESWSAIDNNSPEW